MSEAYPLDLTMRPKIEAQSVKKAARELENDFNKAMSSIPDGKMTEKIKKIGINFNKALSGSKEMQARMKQLESLKIPTAEFTKAQEKVDNLTKRLKATNEEKKILEESGRTRGPLWESVTNAVKTLPEELKKAQAELQQLVDTGKDFTLGVDTDEYKQLVSNMEQTNNSMRTSLSQLSAETGKTASQAAIRVKNTMSQVFSGTIANARRLLSNLKKIISTVVRLGQTIITSGIGKLRQIFLGGSNGAQSFHDKLKHGIRTVLAYGLGIQTLVSLFSKLRGVATEALKRMAQQIPEVNRDISALMSSLQNWKNAIGSMFQPLLAAITPVLTQIIDKLTAVTTKVAEFFAALTGQKYIYKASKANIDYAKSLDKNTKAKKKNNEEDEKALGSYDKLEVIQKNKKQDTDDDTAGYNADAAKGKYQKVPIDPKWQKWIDWLKDMWKNGDFFALGAKFAKWMTDLLNKIPWDKIKAFARKLGSSIATFLNGVFADLEFAKALGRTIGEAFNTALDFAYEIVTKFDFKQFGKFIGTMISTALKTIDWEKLKKLGTELGKGLANAIKGFLLTDALVQIGSAIGNLFRTVVNMLWSFVTEMPWKMLGVRLRQGVNAMFNRMLEVDESGKSGFKKLGEAISGFIKGMFTAINEVLGDEDTRNKIALALREFLDGFDYDGIRDSLLTFAGNLVSLFAVCLKEAFASDAFQQALPDLITVLSAVIGVSLFGTIAKMAASHFVDAWMTNLAEQWVAKGATKAVADTAAGAASEAGAAAGAEVAAAGTSIAGSVMTWAAGLAAAVAAFFVGADIGKLIGYTMKPDDAELYEGYMGVKGTCQMMKDLWDALAYDIGTKIDAFKEKHTVLWSALKQSVSMGLTFLKNSFANAFGSIYSYVFGVLQRIIDGIALVKTAMNTIREAKERQNQVNSARTLRAGAGSTYLGGLAKGAVIPPNKEFIATLGDQKSGVNVETPLSTMIEAFKTAIGDMGGTGGGNQAPIMLQLDGRTVAQVVWDEQNKRYRQTGQYSPRMA